eukprot:Skav203765  [mRNA]  locus=scaffold206:43065:45457:- [translate_table: standard]
MDPAVLGGTATLIVGPGGARKVHALADAALVTIGPRVQRCCSEGLVVHSFQDVILAPSRPCMLRVLAIHPKRRPGSTGDRRMVEVQNEEAIFEPLIRLQPNRFAPLGTAQDLRCVHTHVDAVE